MCANWTRCSGRTSTLAPASSSRNGAPGTGTSTASAGRWIPRPRLILNSEAASAVPVEPPATSASARPSATAATAWTIEASGLARTARAGSSALAIETGASISSTPSATGPICAAGPKSSTRVPRSAARAAPRATSAGPRSAPFASTATATGSVMRGALVVVVVLVVLQRDHLAALVGPAVRAHTVREAGLVALRALVQRRRGDLVLGRAAGSCERATASAWGRPWATGRVAERGRLLEADLRQLRPARVGVGLVRVLGVVVEVRAAVRAQAQAVGRAG